MPDTSPSPESTPRVETPPPTPLLGWFAELRIALAFLTRFPVHLKDDEAQHPLSAGVRAFPLAGIAVALAGSAVYAVADFAGLSPVASALLAIAAMVVATGGLHEDGLADSADGLGGRTPEQRLAIMRDSRIGSFGVMALFFVLFLRVTALSYAGSTVEAIFMMMAGAAGSRAAMPAIMYLLSPARSDGLGWSAGLPDRGRVVDAGAIGAVIVIAALGPVWGLIALAAAALATASAFWLARRRLGGHTGDVLGAVQQLAETAILLAYVASPGWI